MNLEQKINYRLNRYPLLKKAVKRIYQRIMYMISKKEKYEGNINKISPDDKNHEYFFGYYDKSPWDITDRYMLCTRAKNTWSDTTPRDEAEILLIDTWKAKDDESRVIKLATTKTWNVQQSCMLQWIGPDFSSKIIYNDYRDEKYVSIILNIKTGEEKIIPAPVYSVSSNGKEALTLDFSRLYELRPGYGYYNVPEKTKGILLPDSTAIWKINLEYGSIESLFTYSDFATFKPRSEMKDSRATHKVNHIMISPNGKRFMVLYRWIIKGRKYSRLITCDMDGSNMFLLSDDDMISHCCWKNNEEILAYANKKNKGAGYFLMRDKSSEFTQCWPELTSDGHPSYSPDGKFVLTDTYPDRTRMSKIMLMSSEMKTSKPKICARVFSPFRYDNETRCDLHPRWNHKGDSICFDGAFEGNRGMYTVDVTSFTKKKEKDPLISVIVPVYKTEKYLDRCLESLIKQTYKNIEIILIDDGSPDNCAYICDSYAKTYSNIFAYHKENGGLSSARNLGIEKANGDYLAFVDSDDWIAYDMYEKLLNYILEFDADISDIRVKQLTKEEDVINQAEKIEIIEGKKILEHYLYRGLNEQGGAPYSVARKLFNRSLFNGDTAEFDENTINEDICFNYKILEKCNKIVVSNQIKYFYFQGESSITTGELKIKDLDLLKVTDELVRLARLTKDDKIIELAIAKRIRSDFSLLSKIAVNGIEETVNEPNKLIEKLLSNLRRNLFIIFKSPMPINRKVLALLFSLNYNLSCKIIRQIKKLY